MNYIKQVLDRLFESLENHDVPYCVLHGYETLPEHAPSDVDIAIDPKKEKELDTIIYRLAAETGSVVTQKLYYDVPRCYYYVICHASNNQIDIVQLDFLIDDIGINRYFFTSLELIKNRRRFRTFYIPEVSIEFLYLFLKKIIKAKFYKEHQTVLRQLYLANPYDIENKLIFYFAQRNLPLIKKIILESEEAKREDIRHLRRSFQKRNISVLKKIQGMFWLAKRIMSRIVHPTGMSVVILSPDGGGKTSVAKGILQVLKQSFRRTRYLYWRPGILPEIRDLMRLRFRKVDERTNPNPHGKEERGRLISYVRFFYYTFDFLLGYLKIRFLKTITTLVVMDRYYYDFMVDKKRYGFNIPDWLPKIIFKIIPKPDLVIYLDNEPEEFYARKKELPLPEIRRQIKQFRELVSKIPNSYTVNTKKPLNYVIQETAEIVIKTKAENLKRLLGVS